MTDRMKTLKSLSFSNRRSGQVHVESSRPNTLRDPVAEPKQGKLSKLLEKLPAHTFTKDAFDNVTSRVRTQKDDGRGNSEFVGTHSGTRGSSSIEFGKGALTGHYSREAVAGAYLSKSGAVSGKNGSASYDAQLQAETRSSVDARGRVDANGVNATVTARAHASVEASVRGSATTRPVTIFGVQTDAGVEASARAVAELNAEVTGTAQITRKPPTAILEGKAGASAVAKIEGDIEAHVGPFSVRGSAYGSAGAEAVASGIIGYKDGKLQLGGSAGAAFGLGAGGDVAVEVDVGMIGDAAKNAADRNHDGKLDVRDVGAGVVQVAGKGLDAAKAVGRTADKWKDRLFG